MQLMPFRAVMLLLFVLLPRRSAEAQTKRPTREEQPIQKPGKTKK
jgi:hypothetical protein